MEGLARGAGADLSAGSKRQGQLLFQRVPRAQTHQTAASAPSSEGRPHGGPTLQGQRAQALAWRATQKLGALQEAPGSSLCPCPPQQLRTSWTPVSLPQLMRARAQGGPEAGAQRPGVEGLRLVGEGGKG